MTTKSYLIKFVVDEDGFQNGEALIEWVGIDDKIMLLSEFNLSAAWLQSVSLKANKRGLVCLSVFLSMILIRLGVDEAPILSVDHSFSNEFLMWDQRWLGF